MKESMWGYAIIVLGILAIGIIWFFANTTKTDQHNYNLLKETTEAAMLDAVDLAAYRQDGTVKIDEEKFVESFVRRFAENADLSNEYYKIEIYDINETPPKVSLRVSSASKTSATGEIVEFDVVNNIDAILETKYSKEIEVEEETTEAEEETEADQNVQTTTPKYQFVTEDLTYTIGCMSGKTVTAIASEIIPSDARIISVLNVDYNVAQIRNVDYAIFGNKIKFYVECRVRGNAELKYKIAYYKRVL